MLTIPDYRLRLPGPTAVPERVRQATALPVLNHRGAEFKAMLAECQQRLKPIFGTTHDVLISAGSGTAMMEAALINILSPGDAVLIVVAGQFGDRFVSIAKAFGASVYVPTAKQLVRLGQDTPFRMLSAVPVGLGLGMMDQLVPSQRSTNVFWKDEGARYWPTA